MITNPADKRRAFDLKAAAYDQATRKQITDEFYEEVAAAIDSLHASPEESTIEDLPQDILEYVHTLETGDAR